MAQLGQGSRHTYPRLSVWEGSPFPAGEGARRTAGSAGHSGVRQALRPPRAHVGHSQPETVEDRAGRSPAATWRPQDPQA